METLTFAPLDEAPPANPLPAAGAPVLGRRWSDGAGQAPSPSDSQASWSMAQHWPALVATLSEQAVESSNLVLRAMDFLVGAGRLRPAEAKALSDVLNTLRETSVRAQQITRLASGRIRQANDRVDLADVVRQVLDERGAELAQRSAEVRTVLESADVLLDPPAAAGMVHAIIDWALSFSREIVLTLKAPEAPGPARLLVSAATQPRARAPGEPGWTGQPRGRRLNDGLQWMLLRQMAASAHIAVTREPRQGCAQVTIEFPKTFANGEGIATMELMDAQWGALPTRDSWVLVVVRDPVLRRASLAALAAVGVEARGAADYQEAQRCMLAGKPQLMVVGYDSMDDQLHDFRRDAIGPDGKCPLVEITKDSPSFHVNGFEGYETAKVGRDEVVRELAPAVLFELVRHA